MPAQTEQFVSYSLFWFTLSLINAGLAQSKGRSGAAWWLASLFIGPLATLLIVAWPRVAHTEHGQEQALTGSQLVVWTVVLVLVGLVLAIILLGAVLRP